MNVTLKRFLKAVLLLQPIRQVIRKGRIAIEIADWYRRGKPAPPPHAVKQRVLKKYARQYRLRILVETGTYHGEMVDALKGRFDRIYSIELSPDFHERAKRRFGRQHHIELIQGDSGVELGSVMRKLDQAALFWLDGHYSGGDTARGPRDTPIYEELRHILGDSANSHVVIIDDARCFGTDPAYPTIADLTEFIESMKADVAIRVRDDSVRITPTA
jgi:hypothetical protein